MASLHQLIRLITYKACQGINPLQILIELQLTCNKEINPSSPNKSQMDLVRLLALWRCDQASDIKLNHWIGVVHVSETLCFRKLEASWLQQFF